MTNIVSKAVLNVAAAAVLLLCGSSVEASSCAIDVSKVRGFNINHSMGEADYRDMAEMKVNAVRLSLADIPVFQRDGELDSRSVELIKRNAIWAAQQGIVLFVDAHTFPGSKKRYSGSPDDRIWRDDSLRDSIIKSYGQLARQLKPYAAVVGYDVLNEPAPPEGTAGSEKLTDFLEKIRRELLAVDSSLKVIIQPPVVLDANRIPTAQYRSWSAIAGFSGSDVIKSLHYYEPGNFTHQGILGFKSGVDLPLALKADFSFKAYVNNTLSKIDVTDGPVLVGEFSVSNFAGMSGNAYLKNLIDVFESKGFGWFYHAFREARVWDPEIDDANDPAAKRSMNSPKMKILKSYFKNNKKLLCG